jgi:hypothetical protein
MFLKDGRCVLRKGAVLLCRSKLLGCTKEEMFDGELIDEGYSCKLVKADRCEGVNIAFDATFIKDEKAINARLCDYASGTNMPFDDMFAFSIYF